MERTLDESFTDPNSHEEISKLNDRINELECHIKELSGEVSTLTHTVKGLNIEIYGRGLDSPILILKSTGIEPLKLIIHQGILSGK